MDEFTWFKLKKQSALAQIEYTIYDLLDDCSDRTLLSGVNCDGTENHCYLQGGLVYNIQYHTIISGKGELKLINSVYTSTLSKNFLKSTIPSWQVKPQHSDSEYVELLLNMGFYIEFSKWKPASRVNYYGMLHTQF